MSISPEDHRLDMMVKLFNKLDEDDQYQLIGTAAQMLRCKEDEEHIQNVDLMTFNKISGRRGHNGKNK